MLRRLRRSPEFSSLRVSISSKYLGPDLSHLYSPSQIRTSLRIFTYLRYHVHVHPLIAYTRAFLLSFFSFACTIRVLASYATNSYDMWVGSNVVADVMKRDSKRVQIRATITHVGIIQLETNRNRSVICVPGRNTHRACVTKAEYTWKGSTTPEKFAVLKYGTT